jgi:hypothetical protein
MTRRRWDYFVRYLANGIPPYEYQMKPWTAVTFTNGPSGYETGDDTIDLGSDE